MLAFLNQVRKPTLDLPLEVRRKMWFKPFMQSYLVVFIGYLTMYLIRKNFNIAQNDMISTYGLSMTQLGMILRTVVPRLFHHWRVTGQQGWITGAV